MLGESMLQNGIAADACFPEAGGAAPVEVAHVSIVAFFATFLQTVAAILAGRHDTRFHAAERVAAVVIAGIAIIALLAHCPLPIATAGG